jgi:hypothetical protein
MPPLPPTAAPTLPERRSDPRNPCALTRVAGIFGRVSADDGQPGCRASGYLSRLHSSHINVTGPATTTGPTTMHA